MKITYEKAASSDIECLYQLCKQLIDAYENIECIDYERASEVGPKKSWKILLMKYNFYLC